MNKSQPSSLTPEEAVARLVSLDYIPPDCSLLELTAAFLAEATDDLAQARRKGRSAAELAQLESRRKVCRHRHLLAKLILAELHSAIKRRDQSLLVLADDAVAGTRLTLESVWDWAVNRYGFSVPEWIRAPAPAPPVGALPAEVPAPSALPAEAPAASATAAAAPNRDVPTADARWEEVAIKIYAKERLAWRYGQGKWRTVPFLDVGLIGRRKRKPNRPGELLISLSELKKFPPDPKLAGRHKAEIFRLRAALRRLTGIEGDPFRTYNKADGYLPRFTLIDDRRNADERAKSRARHSSEDDFAAPECDSDEPEGDAPDFAPSRDKVGQWLKANDPKSRR